jgi:hypothetical protein
LKYRIKKKGIVLIKLDNGYNVGFNRKDVSEIKLVKKKEKTRKLKPKLKKIPKSPTCND